MSPRPEKIAYRANVHVSLLALLPAINLFTASQLWVGRHTKKKSRFFATLRMTTSATLRMTAGAAHGLRWVTVILSVAKNLLFLSLPLPPKLKKSLTSVRERYDIDSYFQAQESVCGRRLEETGLCAEGGRKWVWSHPKGIHQEDDSEE